MVLNLRSDRIVARNFLSLGSGEAAARIISFVATIYVARVLGASAYGTVEVAAAVILYLSRVVDWGVDLGLGVREVAGDPKRAAELGPTILTIRLTLAVLLTGIVSAVALLWLPEPDGSVLAAYSLTLLAVGVSPRWIHLGFERAHRIAVARTVGELAMVVAVIVAVRAPDQVVRVPLARFLGDALTAALLLWWLRRLGVRLIPRFRWRAVRPLIRPGAYLMLGALLGLMIYNADLLLLRIFRDASHVGVYAAGYTLVAFLGNLGIAYGLSLLPTLTRLQTSPKAQLDLYRTAMAQTFAVALPVAAGGFLFAPRIIDLVFGQSYAASAGVLAILIWTIPTALFRDVALTALLATGREKEVMRITGWAAALNMGLNLLLIPRYGLIGAAAATIVTEAARMLLSQRAAGVVGFRMPGPARFWRVLLAGGAMVALLLLLRPQSLLGGMVLGVLFYAGALTVVGGIRWRPRQLPELTV